MAAKIIAFRVPWRRAEVRCYSGYKADEYPIYLKNAGKWLRIIEILDRWYDPHNNYFKVKAETGKTYLLKWYLEEDTWWTRPI